MGKVVVSLNKSNNDGTAVLVVTQERPSLAFIGANESIVTNVVTGERATELYEELLGKRG